MQRTKQELIDIIEAKKKSAENHILSLQQSNVAFDSKHEIDKLYGEIEAYVDIYTLLMGTDIVEPTSIVEEKPTSDKYNENYSKEIKKELVGYTCTSNARGCENDCLTCSFYRPMYKLKKEETNTEPTEAPNPKMVCLENNDCKRDDQFREFDSVSFMRDNEISFVNAKQVNSLSLGKHEDTYYIAINVGQIVMLEFETEQEQLTKYQELCEWVKYWNS